MAVTRSCTCIAVEQASLLRSQLSSPLVLEGWRCLISRTTREPVRHDPPDARIAGSDRRRSYRPSRLFRSVCTIHSDADWYEVAPPVRRFQSCPSRNYWMTT